jgi:signal transduction histidine kinase
VSLRVRLVLAAAYVLVVAVVALAIPLALKIQQGLKLQVEQALETNAVLIAARINDELPKAGTDPAMPPRPNQHIESIVGGAARATDTRVIVIDKLGRVVVDSDGLAEVGTVYATNKRPEFSAVFTEPAGQIDARHRPSETLREDLLLVTAPVVHNREVIGAVRMSEPTREVENKTRRSWIGLGLVSLMVILVGMAAAWFLASWLNRRVAHLEGTARRLELGDLDSRASTAGPRELSNLARSFNRMAEALTANIGAQRDFMANASHQLRTPLTGLRLRLEAIEQEGGFAAGEARKAQREIGRLSDLVDDLLTLAKASSVDNTGSRLDLAEEAMGAVDRWLGPVHLVGKQIIAYVDGPCPVWADPDDLGQVLDNLIENSLRYSSEGAQITVQTRNSSHGCVVVVSDTGPGIADEDRDHVFERFYRGSTGRRAGLGSGLGLAVVAELARRWNGEVRLTIGQGTSVEVSLPGMELGP